MNKRILLGILILQNTLAVLLARYTRSKYNYDVKNMLFVAEVTKLLASCILEHLHGLRRNLVKSLRKHIWESPWDALKLSVPAFLYFIQNILVYYSISHVPVPLFQVTQQTKLITTAFLSVFFFKRSYSAVQWFSLISLCAGVSICILGQNKGGNNEEVDMSTSFGLIGLVMVVASNLCSSIAGIYFEKVIKAGTKNEPLPSTNPTHAGSQQDEGSKMPSIWMRNIQISFYTICIIGLHMVSTISNKKPAFFHDFSPILWFQIMIFAFGGLLVASVIKHCDSVQKGLSVGLSVVISSMLSGIFEKNHFSLQFILGASLAIGGCFFFAHPAPLNKSWSYVLSKRTKYAIPLLTIITLTFASCWTPMIFELNKFRGTPMIFDLNNFRSLNVVPYSKVPEDFRNKIHFHSLRKHLSNCGGCKVLIELHEVLSAYGYSSSLDENMCPPVEFFEEQIASDKILVFVYPETTWKTCIGPGNRVHVHWVLAPLGTNAPLEIAKSQWQADDPVFNYAASTAAIEVPSSNILQVITSPTKGDETDITNETFFNKNRSGIAWMMRKGRKWHQNLTYIHERQHEGLNSMEVFNPSAIDFQKFEYFVSYDPYTFFSYLSAMSGAVSIVYPLANVSKKEWALGTYVGEYIREVGGEVPGIAYGWNEEEINYARRTMPELREFMFKVKTWGHERTVERFARDCYRYGKGERSDFEGAILVHDAYPDLFPKSL